MIKKRLFSIKMYPENRNGHIYEPDYAVKFTGFNYISVFPDYLCITARDKTEQVLQKENNGWSEVQSVFDLQF